MTTTMTTTMNTTKTTCFIIGDGTMAIQCGEGYLAAGHQVLGVVTADQGTRIWAESLSIPSISPADDVHGFLAAQPFDYLFNIVNFIIPDQETLALPRRAAINFHDSPLPRYAGINATSWALINGEQEYAVSWHLMLDELDRGRWFIDTVSGKRRKSIDTGRILETGPIGIDEDETAFKLNIKCYGAGIRAFHRLVEKISNGTLGEGDVQDLDERSYFAKFDRPEAACLLDFQHSARELRNFVGALYFGRYANPLGWPKFRIDDEYVVIANCDVAATASASDLEPGTVVAVDADSLTLATGAGDLVVETLRSIDGAELSISEFARRHALVRGSRIDHVDDATRTTITRLNRRCARAEENWVETLAELAPLQLPVIGAATGAPKLARVQLPDAMLKQVSSDADANSELYIAAFLTLLARLTDQPDSHVFYTHDSACRSIAGLENLFSRWLPLALNVDINAPLSAASASILSACREAERRGPYLRDLVGRHPELRELPRARSGQPDLPVAVAVSDDPATICLQAQIALGFAINPDADDAWIVYDETRITAENIRRLLAQFEAFLTNAASAPDTPLSDLSLVSDEERRRLLQDWNATELEVPKQETIHSLFQRQAQATPQAVAVRFADDSYTYGELEQRSNALANYLQETGIAQEALVGVFMERSVEVMVAILGILKAGAAYVPLDPDYPSERLAFMIGDAQLAAVITQARLQHRLSAQSADIIAIDADWQQIESAGEIPCNSTTAPDSLAYVIYTSGSTGRPKGVMIEHRNVVNFFSGMDQVVSGEPGKLLAVTSLNFDISVLELLWTLTRGFEVVLYREPQRTASGQSLPHADKAIDFGLFYFSGDAGENPDNKYQLLLEGAKFADDNGFSAVWTPERHFHDFGGLYANPSVTSAALATITKNVALRSGSCVAPLHSSIRIAEEWSMVDNLSGGRVGVSLASGWQPNDFAIRPDQYANRQTLLYEQVETVRRLWRGESVPFTDGSGKEIEITTQPRPLQVELPMWITAAGNPQTVETAGRLGCNLLTHLLGQSIDEVAENITRYRNARQQAGHQGPGTVTLMLHTFVADSTDEAKTLARKPMIEYLRSAMGLVKKAAWEWPAYRDKTTNPDGNFSTDHLSREEEDALLEFAFERYFDSSGLFGDIERCVALVDRLKGIGVNEIACLCDFGIAADTVLAHLPKLKEVLVRSNRQTEMKAGNNNSEQSIAELLKQHDITHLQCTPSMARMLTLDADTRAALKPLQHMLVGGEALPAALAEELCQLVDGRISNMYGPTETTIWSATHKVSASVDGGQVPIGKPIANTSIVLLDHNQQLIPPGTIGELYIGGKGVARGYLRRDELTAGRFVQNPYGRPGERLYRTGDLARWNELGVLEFHGRVDQQVKLRGHRIELGEIESALAAINGVREAVVLVHEDLPGDQRLIAYIVADGECPDSDRLRGSLRDKLPEFMLPQVFVFMEAFPQTPNKKIDRNAFPAPAELEQQHLPVTMPQTDTQKAVAKIWHEVLGIDQIDIDSNFIDLGGHSLLSVTVQLDIKKQLNKPISLVDVFRNPTIRGLADFLDKMEETSEAA